MDFDTIIESLGEFGRYQAFIYFLLCLPVIFSAASIVGYVFTAGIPKYRCFIPHCDNSSHSFYNESWLEYAVPFDKHGDPVRCSMYAQNSSVSNETCTADIFTSTVEKCHKWVYDDSDFKSTIVTEWDITCNRKWMISVVGTVYFSGIFVGSVLFGFLADKFGRKKVLMLCIIIMLVSGIGIALSENFITFIILQFFNAVGNATIFPTAFILGLELVSVKKRVMAGIIIEYFFSIGEAMVGALAWLFRDWRKVQLAISAPAAIFIIYIFIIPESVRWLIAEHRYGEAAKIIKKAAAVNGVSVPEHLLNGCDRTEFEQQQATQPRSSLKAMLQSRKLFLRSCNIFFNWMTNALVYYGLSLHATSLGGNIFLNFILVSLIEIPGYTFAWFAMTYLGRKRALSGSLFISGLSLFAAAFIPTDASWATITLYLAGKFGITSSFATIYVYSAEMFPTVLRNAGVGMSSMFARIGAIVAPFVSLLGSHMEAAPFLLFGGMSCAAGLLAMFFPETLGRQIPDTVAEAEAFGSSQEENVERAETPANERTPLLQGQDDR